MSLLSGKRKKQENDPAKRGNRRRWALFVLVTLLLCALNGLCLANTLVIGGSEQYVVDASALSGYGADCVLVLGARVYTGGRPSLILRDRLERGLELYKSGAGRKLLLSGDHGTAEYDEVNAMKEYALSETPRDDVFLDHAGFSTYESIYRAKEVFGAKSIVIVTQRFHVYRAVYVARKLGLEAYGVPADIHNYYLSTNIKNEMREEVARAKDWTFVNLFKPLPKYLGDPIDLRGSGTVTFD